MEKWICKTVVIWLLCSAGAQGGLSRLEALGMLESGNNDRAVGGAGEISRYQILPRVWRSYTKSTAYVNADIASRVAQRHLEYLEANFRKRVGREPTDFDCYVMWNAGLSYYARVGFTVRRVHATIRERARRFVNLRRMELQAGSPAGRATPKLPDLAQPSQPTPAEAVAVSTRQGG